MSENMRDVLCECCGEPTTGEIQYRPLHRKKNYTLCPTCSWQCGNFADMVRLTKRSPTYEDCQKRLRRSGLEVHAVLPQSREEYKRLVRFWKKTHSRLRMG